MSVSIVVTSRNDGYGGNLELRASYALNTMLQNYDEVIYVDWNSPNEESLIKNLPLMRTGRLRHIQLTKNDIEKINPTLLNYPIVEVLGRNIGIRRATSDWVVSSNIDIMPSKIDTKLLNQDFLYTVSRKNVPVEYFLNNKEFSIQFCVNNSNNFDSVPKILNGDWAGKKDPWSLTACCGDFQLANKFLWNKMRGFEEAMVFRDFADTNLMKKGIIYGVGAELLDIDIFHLNHGGHEMSVNGQKLQNDYERYVENFTESENPISWGLESMSFKEEII
jgi:hypothetical protein